MCVVSGWLGLWMIVGVGVYVSECRYTWVVGRVTGCVCWWSCG